MRIQGAIVIDTERCKGCNLCAVSCPKDVIALSQTKVNHYGYHYAEPAVPDACIGCAACGMVCPDGCITVYKKKVED
jgi:2-oxoglutarate ferredoxin oxidoreductase subunit delta